MALKVAKDQGLRFAWLYRPQKEKDSHSYGSTGHRRRRTPIHMALQVTEGGLPFIRLYSPQKEKDAPS
jgi:hypothetical protein